MFARSSIRKLFKVAVPRQGAPRAVALAGRAAFSTAARQLEPIRVVPDALSSAIPQALVDLAPSRGITPTLEKFTLKNKVAVVTGYVVLLLVFCCCGRSIVGRIARHPVQLTFPLFTFRCSFPSPTQF